MERILVSGASGFTGHELVRQAIAQGVDVVALARSGPKCDALLRDFPRLCLIPVTPDLAALRQKLDHWRPDALFHLASDYLPDDHPDGPMRMIAANITFPVTLLEALRDLAPISVIAAGTQWQYAEGTGRYSPNSFYAATKQAFQDILAFYVAGHGFRTGILNLSDCYGHCDPRNRIISQLIAAQQAQQPMDLSPGEQQLDPVHVSDAARGFLHAGQALCEGAMPSGQSWAIRGGRPISLRNVVRLIETVSGAPVPARFGALPYRPGTVMTLWQQPLLPGWCPKIALKEGIAALISAG